jgi:hypothetical protein
MIGGSVHRDCVERFTHTQSGHDPRHVLYQVLRQVADLGARIGDDLLALAVIQFLRHLKRLGGRPAEARAAEFLQRRQIVQFGRSLPLILDAHPKRALETPSRIDYVLGNFAPDNSLLRRVPHLELTARHVGSGDNFKIGQRTKFRISNSRLHTIAKVGVFTRPTPITLRVPWPRMTVAVRVSDRL